MNEHKTAILATRVNMKGEALLSLEGVYRHSDTFVLNLIAKHEHYIAVVTAGTSDIPVAEEAAVTAEAFRNHVKRIYDVGVLGIPPLQSSRRHQGASVVIVIAGMEGAACQCHRRFYWTFLWLPFQPADMERIFKAWRLYSTCGFLRKQRYCREQPTTASAQPLFSKHD